MDITKIDFESLIKQAKQSDSGFSQLYCAIQPYVMFKANTILGSRQDAEDIFQNVSISIYRNLDNIDPKKFLGYLKTTVTNACNDVLRKRIKTTDEGYEIKTVEIDAFDDYRLPSESIDIGLDAEYRALIFKEVLDKIPVNCREVLVLRLIDDMTFKEISNQLNTPEATVKYRFASALKTAEQEIIRIQKRDDIKLYGYSPLALFLLLFKNASENEPVDSVLVEKATRRIFDELTSDISREAAGNVGEDLVKQAAKKAVTSTTSKTGMSALAKTLMLVAILAATGIGGFVGYNVIQTNKEKAIIQSYQDDEVEINIDFDIDTMTIGDKAEFNVNYTSKNDLDYDLEITMDKYGVLTVENNTVVANKTGNDFLRATLINPEDSTIKKTVTKKIAVYDKENLANKLGIDMLKHGYHQRDWFYADFLEDENGRSIHPTLEEFDWSNYVTDYSQWASQDMLDPKTGQGNVGKKGGACGIYGMCGYILINNDGYISNGYGGEYYYDFSYNQDSAFGKSNVYGDEDLDMPFDQLSGQYYYDGVSGKVYFDSTVPFLAVDRAKKMKANYICTYDENYRLIEEYRNGQVIKHIYESDRLVESDEYANSNLSFRTLYYYNDEGLLFGQIYYNVSTDRVQSMIVYSYN